MGTKWMIEDMNTHLWWDGIGWGSDASYCMQFNSDDEAIDCINTIEWDRPVEVTEHIFMSPVSAQENLN
jgi:hypothetical protein